MSTALKAIHSIQVPPALQRAIPKEEFSPQWREKLRSLLTQAEKGSFPEPNAEELAGFMKSRRNEISRLIERAEELAAETQSKPLDPVICHTDIHRANLMVTNNNEFYIVDWDAPLLAPKERDLVFIGGGIDYIWKSKKEEAVFYEGYGSK